MSQAALEKSSEDPKFSPKKFLKQRSILVIDDEHGIRNFLIKGLSKHVGMIESAEDINKAEE
ncbi:MAG: sigma-54-dependent Fis family transcriptional regulator, partial [Gammaproteobacteria bacterium]|nr:sigma-54-dependent Fis family transcriptional regulator [Gammaproteobacteria bacterium]